MRSDGNSIDVSEWSEKATQRALQLAPPWAHDLFGMVALSLLGIFLEFQAPFERYLVPEFLPRYSYPFVANSVPTWALPVLGIFIPLGIILVTARAHKNGLEARRAAAGLCLSVALAFAVTNGVKNGIGAFRPDFAARCWPDGKIAWVSPGVPACRPARPRDVLEGRKSFPSGHTSMSFAGLAYVSIYLTARLRVFAPPDASEASMWRMAVAWAPMALAAAVGISRTQDYWHHWEDVCVGAAIGMCTAAMAFSQKKPLHGIGGPGRQGSGAPFDYAPLVGGDRDRNGGGGGGGGGGGEKNGGVRDGDERGDPDSPAISEGHGSVGGHVGGAHIGGGRLGRSDIGGL